MYLGVLVKVIAERFICAETPKGTVFELPDDDEGARVLIALGHLRRVDEETPRRRYQRRDLQAQGDT